MLIVLHHHIIPNNNKNTRINNTINLSNVQKMDASCTYGRVATVTVFLDYAMKSMFRDVYNTGM